MMPLLKSIKQSFVCLVSLKLALKKSFRISKWELLSFERLFARISPSLKHLDLDFTQNDGVDRRFPPGLGMIIMNHLRKLETLSLNFNLTNTSTGVVRLLISGACTHLTDLKILNLSVKKCLFTEYYWNCSHRHNLTSHLQEIKLEIDGCQGLYFDYLWTLQDDIVALCPDLKSLLLSAQEYKNWTDGFHSAFEKGFLERLRLKRLRFLYPNDFESTWDAYQKTQALELEQAMKIEEEFDKVKKWARGEEEVQLYYKMLSEERQVPIKYEETEYLENHFENQFFEKEKIEEEAQDELVKMAQEYGEGVFEGYYGLEDDPLDRWSMEEETLREFEEK